MSATAAADTFLECAPPLLRVAGLAKRYGEQHALAAVSFNVHAGEVLGLIGPNGAGKTTLLEALAGLIPVEAGELVWRGIPAQSVAMPSAETPRVERRDIMFYLPDGLRPWDDELVVRVLIFFAAVHGRTEREVAETIGSVGLAPALRKRVYALSKGYARRLMLALALLTPQPLLLMDEPFDGFDLRQTREVMGLIRRVAASGRTLMLAIHQLADAERVCDRFVLLADGAVRGAGTLDQLRAQTKLMSASLEDIFLALT
jgi:ABC-type multidrug transport system ATPase subunit